MRLTNVMGVPDARKYAQQQAKELGVTLALYHAIGGARVGLADGKHWANIDEWVTPDGAIHKADPAKAGVK